MNGQLDFDGHEVLGRYVEVPGVGKVEWPMDEELHVDECFEATVRFKLGKVSHGAKQDAQGIAKGDFEEVWKASAMRQTFKVTKYLTRDQLEAAWNAEAQDVAAGV
jgi:hypothetical protein